jgi:CheY-like chemotaxis protein
MLAENLAEKAILSPRPIPASGVAPIDANPGRFASILLDRLMPDMDGIEILRRLKKRGDMADVPVILQTG